jgi:anti-sigma factor RsiW
MAQGHPLSEDERADLVAYLDGELKGEAVRALEAKLQLHPEARSEAEALKKTWELLDFLPRAEPSASFTEKTLSRLVPIPGTEKLPLRKARWRTRIFTAAWVAGVVLAFAVGWIGFKWLFPAYPGEQELIGDLRIIENKRLYDAIEDMDFLKQLGQPELFGDEQLGS